MEEFLIDMPMPQLYSNSFFHYTDEEQKVVGILQNGFMASYANEQFKDTTRNIHHIYIPMICFCDVPLNHIDTIAYGKYAIGMNRAWGNENRLCPVAYYPNDTESHLHKYVSSIVEQYLTRQNADANKLLGYVKPFSKFNNDIDYAQGKRKENYIEREWRKVYLTDWIDSKDKLEEYEAVNGNKKFKNFKLTFSANDVAFIIVPNESSKSSLIYSISQLPTICGQQLNALDRLNLISKIITIEQIKENF